MGSPTSGSLPDFPVVVEIPVWWGDQDAFGHVNNTIFFRWFETVRIAYTSRIGLSEWYQSRRIGPILASVSCNFRRQVRFPDTVLAGARIERLGRTSLTMSHALFSQAQDGRVGDGSSTIVLFDYNSNTPFPIPDELREAIGAIEGATFPQS